MRRKLSRVSLVLALAVMLLVVLILHFRDVSLLNVSSVEAVGGIGVYWDENCTMPVSSISWGNLSLGQEKSVIVYVRNDGNETLFLTEVALNWSPVQASQYLNFSWDITKRELPAGGTVSVAQTLQVFMNTTGISAFSFTITFYGEKIGDLGSLVNGVPTFGAFDGVCNAADLSLFLQCYKGTAPAQWECLGDLGSMVNGAPTFFKCDGKCNAADMALFIICYRGQGP